MMNDSKWIDDLAPGMPVEEAARRVLRVRLGAVVQRVPFALHQAMEDVEHVHQLRVSTRRAAAALRIFADCLAPKRLKKARKYLRCVRRAAGQARDWDVFLLTLAPRLARPRANHRPGLDFLHGFGHGQRVVAQEHLRASAPAEEAGANGSLAQTLDEITAPETPGSLAELAAPMLQQLVDELSSAASLDMTVYENLHQVRIQGKRLRYAMEVFACCFHRVFRERVYPEVEAMQEILGAANDSFVATQRLEALCTHLRISQPREWQRCQPGIEALVRYHQRRLPGQRRQFEAWWQKWHGSRAERNFRNMLK